LVQTIRKLGFVEGIQDISLFWTKTILLLKNCKTPNDLTWIVS